MANIQINEDKYKILTNSLDATKTTVTLKIQDKEIRITPSGRNTSERILGVYIDAFDSPNPTINKLKQIVRSIYHTIKKKKLTHDHLIYIINKVAIPRLEYIMQTTILSDSQCESVLMPLKRLFKHRLYLPLSTPNNIIYNFFFPCLISIKHNQVKAQLANFTAIFYNPTFKIMNSQQIIQTKNEIWYP